MSLCSHDDGMQVASRDQHSVGSWSVSVLFSAMISFCVGWLNTALLYEECINERSVEKHVNPEKSSTEWR